MGPDGPIILFSYLTTGLAGAAVFPDTQWNIIPSSPPQMAAAISALIMPVTVSDADIMPPALISIGTNSPKITQMPSRNMIPLVTALIVGIFSYMPPKIAPRISPTIAINNKSAIIAVSDAAAKPAMGMTPPKMDLTSTNATRDASPISASNKASTPIITPVMIPAIAPSPISFVAISIPSFRLPDNRQIEPYFSGSCISVAVFSDKACPLFLQVRALLACDLAKSVRQNDHLKIKRKKR